MARPVAAFLALVLSGGPVLAAISAAMVWEVQTGGSDTANSGGFRGGSFIAAPSAPTVTPSGSGGTVAASTYYVVVTATDGLGETVASGQTAVTTSGATASFTVTAVAAYTGALTWSVYCGTTSGGPYFPQSTGLTLGVNKVVTATPPTTGTQPRGVDRSLATGVQLAVNNTTVTATTAGANSNVITFSGYTPTGADVGNTYRALTGTNINAGDYEITGVTSTTWTVTGAQNLTTATGAGAALTGNMGGCFASPGQACAFAVVNSSNTIYIKGFAGVYTIANGTANTAGNKLAVGGINLIGYTSNRNPANVDTPPVLDAGAASMSMLATSGSQPQYWHNLSVTNSGTNAAVTAFNLGANGGLFSRLQVDHCATPITISGASVFVDCYLNASGAFGFTGSGGAAIRCASVNPTAGGFSSGTSVVFQDCIVSGLGGANIGFVVGVASMAQNCVVYSATATAWFGFTINGRNAQAIDCITYGPGSVGFAASSLTVSHRVYNCATGGGLTTPIDPAFPASQLSGNVTLGGNPFVNAAGNNFALNTAAGAGAACRGAGIPGTWPGLSTTGYRDIGAAQHSDASIPGQGKKAGPGGGHVGWLDRPTHLYRKAG